MQDGAVGLSRIGLSGPLLERLSKRVIAAVRGIERIQLLANFGGRLITTILKPYILSYSIRRWVDGSERSTRGWQKKVSNSKTYNRRDSQMVTHSSTSRPVQCLCMAERTGCPVFTDLWSYVFKP
jgi:hypothetical protein